MNNPAPKNTLRISSYLTQINIPDEPDSVLLINGLTGAFDRVSHSVVSFMKSLQTTYKAGNLAPPTSKNNIDSQPSSSTINKLVDRGHLTYSRPSEEKQEFIDLVTELHQKEQRNSFHIIPTYNCNLRCDYCFQDSTRTDPSKKQMLSAASTQMIDKILAAIDRLDLDPIMHKPMNSPVGLYGGEPLLSTNERTIRHIVDNAKSRTFSAVTNGTELDKYEDLLGPHCITSLQITLDGTKENHNKRRIYENGSGSFNQIVSNIDLALERSCKIQLRVNCDLRNVDSLVGLAKFILEKKWHTCSEFIAYASPVVSSNQSFPISFLFDKRQARTTFHLQNSMEVAQEKHPELSVIKLPDSSLERTVQSVFEDKAAIYPRPSFCSAHTGMHLFDPLGNIFSCWEHAGKPGMRIGYVAKSGDIIYEREREETWKSRTVLTNNNCIRCPHALFCGGGCAARALDANGTILSNYCDSFGMRFQHAVIKSFSKHRRIIYDQKD